MRLWSFHPCYLDSKGLVAVWREGLLAQKVLLGGTKGYVNHPQLLRFKKQNKPGDYIAAYLYHIYCEAEKRNYHFNSFKIISAHTNKKILCTCGQLDFEWIHFMKKIKKREPDHYKKLKKIEVIIPHPVFDIVEGGVEEWEKLHESPILTLLPIWNKSGNRHPGEAI